MNLLSLTAVELGKKIKAHEVTVEEATRAALDAIRAKEKDINSFVTVDEESAMIRAKEVQKMIDDGKLTGLKQFTDDLKKRQLTVKVMSFAYKKGIPDDPTGNGGGYVFDCRAVNNPGKYERYKPFTGLDEPVITFLEEDGEILRFLDHVYALVDASVKRYMERGFSNLSVCFGCTGGQHRSVYSAQHLAEHLNKKFGVKVELVHREQNIERTFEATI